MSEGLEQDLASLLNRYSQENGRNTPDFQLAAYLRACLARWKTFVVKRDAWYGTRQASPAPEAT
jgi:hypothetical protein